MSKKIPLRKCLGCGEMIAKKEMLRIVKTKENDVLLDSTGKLNGRGAYIHLSKTCLDKTIKSKGLERSFKMSIGSELYDKLCKEMMEIE